MLVAGHAPRVEPVLCQKAWSCHVCSQVKVLLQSLVPAKCTSCKRTGTTGIIRRLPTNQPCSFPSFYCGDRKRKAAPAAPQPATAGHSASAPAQAADEEHRQHAVPAPPAMGFVPGADPVQGFPVVKCLPADEGAAPSAAAGEAPAGTPGFMQLMQGVALGLPMTPG